LISEVQFELQHDFDAPLDALELAVLSPDLGPLLGESFGSRMRRGQHGDVGALGPS